MEKQKVTIDYRRSGVNTLNGFGRLFLIVGILLSFGTLISLFLDIELGSFIILIGASVSSFILGAICTCLSGIAKTSLYQRSLLEHQYDFVDADSKSESSGETTQNAEQITSDHL
jgi:hypothetical protein